MQQIQAFENDEFSSESQLDGPGNIIVNEQVQNQAINEQDESFEGSEQEKAYTEGKMNNSDTDAKPTVKNQVLEDLPGTQTDPEKLSTQSTDKA